MAEMFDEKENYYFVRFNDWHRGFLDDSYKNVSKDGWAKRFKYFVCLKNEIPCSAVQRMNSSSNQQDIKLYYKGNIQTTEAIPKIQTAFSAGNQSGTGSQSSVNTSGFSNVNPPSVQSANVGNGHMI
ncbi:hypothetical protein HanRHA438_Chr04g0166011 [Helianthus annuus]|nr:hypothetical protein HanRHA438_Chr04g0166011 [Helianthus annuus]